MKAQELADLLAVTNKLWLVSQLEKPEYAHKTIIMSSDDLTGDETDAELENIVALRELVQG